MHKRFFSVFWTGVVFLALVFGILQALIPAESNEPAVDMSPLEIPKRMIIEKKPDWLTAESEPILTVAAAGDLMLSSWIIDLVAEHGVDFPFDSTREFLQTADVAIANLEAPLTAEGEKVVDKTYTFKVPPHFVEGIVNAGLDVMTMANNHIVDYGCLGLMNSIETLQKAGIAHCGAGANREEACAPAIVNVNGTVVAFLGISMTYPEEFWATKTRCGTCYPSEAALWDIIIDCERLADLTVVSFHWGAEKSNEPREYQRRYAHLAIDAGADLVLGHHPHVLQGLEMYKGKLIAYSLGNYIFASYSDYAFTSVILRAKISPDGLVMARLVPINVYNYSIHFQPVPFKGEKKQQVINDLNAYSARLNSGKILIDNDGYILPASGMLAAEK